MTLQQGASSLALDGGLATKAFPKTRIIALFEAENERNGAGDADLELSEFLQLVIVLETKRAVSTQCLQPFTNSVCLRLVAWSDRVL